MRNTISFSWQRGFALLTLLASLAGCSSRGLVRSELAGKPSEGPRQVLVVPADLVITEITFGKTEERVISAERQASQILTQHVHDVGAQQQAYAPVAFNNLDPEEQDVVLQHRALFATMVGQILLVKEDAIDAWAGKARYFDYTLGPGMADIARRHKVDTAIFIVGKDKIRSTSRKVLDAITTILPGAESLSAQPAAVVMAIVNMPTGDIIMFDSDMASRKSLTNDGDVRAMGDAVLTDFRKVLKPAAGGQ